MLQDVEDGIADFNKLAREVDDPAYKEFLETMKVKEKNRRAARRIEVNNSE